jgi:HTH-type transcriptional repressor of NAD biosynthesis genes
MTRGLIIGKFMPVHQGHIELIKFGASRCDELIVSLSFTDADPIDPELRFSWLQAIFHDDENIKISKVKDDFDDESLPMESRTQIWANFIRKTYPPVDCIYSSEQYGEPLAKHLGVKNILFDLQRGTVPVSASMIRKDTFANWQFIPAIVRPFFVKKFCFYGPESTGKSTYAKRMAGIYETEFVPEVAREMLVTNDFGISTIIEIGIAQTERVLARAKTANKLLFCDTDLITTQIYSSYYLNTIPQILFDLEVRVHYDHYFLFDIDVPWVADGLRDLGHKREYMYEIFKSELDKRKIPYTKVQGTPSERENIIRSVIDQVLQ